MRPFSLMCQSSEKFPVITHRSWKHFKLSVVCNIKPEQHSVLQLPFHLWQEIINKASDQFFILLVALCSLQGSESKQSVVTFPDQYENETFIRVKACFGVCT